MEHLFDNLPQDLENIIVDYVDQLKYADYEKELLKELLEEVDNYEYRWKR